MESLKYSLIIVDHSLIFYTCLFLWAPRAIKLGTDLPKWPGLQFLNKGLN